MRQMGQLDQWAVQEGLNKRLIQACSIRLPYETCGIVLGFSQHNLMIADDFAIVRNISPTPSRAFQFAPDSYIRAVYEAQKNQRDIVGFFHSHPNHLPIPSQADEDGWPGGHSYWIIGFAANQNPELRIYAQDDGESAWIPLTPRIIPSIGDQCLLK